MRRAAAACLCLNALLFAVHNVHVSAQSADAYIARVEAYSNFDKLFEAAAPWIDDAQRKNQIRVAQGYVSQMRAELEWSGAKGALVWVEIEQEASTGYVRTVGNPVYLGYGESPMVVLRAALRSPSVLSGPSDGFSLAPDKSFFIWVTPAKDSLAYGAIRAPFVDSMFRDAAVGVTDEQISKLSAVETQRRLLDAAMTQLQVRASDNLERARFSKTNEAIKEQMRAVDEINARLARQMDQANKASEFATRLKILSGVLSMASWLSEATQVLTDEDPKQVAGAQNEQALIKLTDEYEIRTRDSVERGKRELTVTEDQLRSILSGVRTDLRAKGAPDSVADPATTLP
ncbi:hypothetical protein [Burkholderia vietnamiensis]|uniref:hypothetical protein n=1 Tax=Burkholderia vietnamiensis TaxID=60552 RepID=UPI000756B85B|nr:hypothetical protein [Burkholderia vietnamiensis]KVF01191.1 hypothetical protein WJ04_01365 [Burkholderia vietnamiensis]